MDTIEDQEFEAQTKDFVFRVKGFLNLIDQIQKSEDKIEVAIQMFDYFKETKDIWHYGFFVHKKPKFVRSVKDKIEFFRRVLKNSTSECDKKMFKFLINIEHELGYGCSATTTKGHFCKKKMDPRKGPSSGWKCVFHSTLDAKKREKVVEVLYEDHDFPRVIADLVKFYL